MADFTEKQRENLAEKGKAMPHGGFPIRNRQDLLNAIRAIGRAKDKPKTRRWIIKRAKQLDLLDLVPEEWLQHMSTTAVDNFLAHYGVKGMKWGQRKAHSREMRRLNKESRARDKAERSENITRARERFRSGKAREDYKKAKSEYKAQRHVIGKREAKKILTKVRDQNVKDYETANSFKNGKEIAGAIALGVGATVLVSTLKALSS